MKASLKQTEEQDWSNVDILLSEEANPDSLFHRKINGLPSDELGGAGVH